MNTLVLSSFRRILRIHNSLPDSTYKKMLKKSIVDSFKLRKDLTDSSSINLYLKQATDFEEYLPKLDKLLFKINK